LLLQVAIYSGRRFCSSSAHCILPVPIEHDLFSGVCCIAQSINYLMTALFKKGVPLQVFIFYHSAILAVMIGI
jgi:hypothetical protein